MTKPGRPDLDAAGAACRNAEHELEDLTEQLRSLRFRREHFDLRSGYGAVFTSLTLALHHLDCAKDDLREAADGFYADDPDVFWIDADGRTHYYEEEKS